MFGGEADPGQPMSLPPLPALTPTDENIKRPPNAFILYLRAIKEGLSNANPQLSDLELNKLIGRSWQMSDETARGYYRGHATALADQFKELHPDYPESRPRKVITVSPAKTAEPIRLKVILDGCEQDGILPGPQLTEDPLGLLKVPVKGSQGFEHGATLGEYE
jgi:hypothetical protein